MGVSLCGVWLFHARPRWRLLSYALFSVGVQLKIYPAILRLAADRRLPRHDRQPAARCGAGTRQLPAVVCLRPAPLCRWLHAFGQLAFQFSGPANHSIDSFSVFAAETLARHWSLPESFPAVVRALMLASLGVSLVTVLLLNRRQQALWARSIPATGVQHRRLADPPISYDYKLSLLVPAVALRRWSSSGRLPTAIQARSASRHSC